MFSVHVASAAAKDGVDIGADTVEMMFRQPDCVDAEPVAELRLGYGFADDASIVFRCFGGGKDEVAEFHNHCRAAFLPAG